MTVLTRLDSPACGCDSRDVLAGLLSIDQAQARIEAEAAPVADTETLPLARAAGRVLAAPVRAATASPRFDNAAMDGYAICTAALTGQGHWRLPVLGRMAAGQGPAEASAEGGAVRIFTGAPIPPGADAVVMQEHVHRTGDHILLRARPAPGSHIRRAGEEMQAGETVLPAGRRLGSRDIAAAAAAGCTTLRLRRRVRVGLVVTGDEVAPDAPGSGRIADVNGPMLAAEMARADVDFAGIFHAGDDLEALRDALARLAGWADLVVTTGGVSVGDADLIKPALAALGGQSLFEGVALKPGKPVSFGRLRSGLWLGLPGNPVSAFVTWRLFGTRLLARLSGDSAAPRRRHVVAGATLDHRPGRCETRPARIVGFDGSGREVIDCAATTHSARATTLADADGLILIPADAETIPQGGLLEFLPFTDC